MDTTENKKSLSILDYWNVFFVNKKNILLISFISGVLAALIVFFVIKPVFYSYGTIKTSSSKSSMLGGILSSSGLGDLGDFGDLAPGSGSSANELALYENIIFSRALLEETIVRFNIMEEENFKYMYDAIKYFSENILVVTKDKVAGTLTIGIFDTNPSKAKEIVEFLITRLNDKNIELSVQSAMNNRIFIEERYNLARKDLKKIEDSLQNFQDIYGIAPDLQVQLAAKSSIELEANIKSEEIKLELLRKILSPNESEILVQQDKINILKKQLNEIKNNEYEAGDLNLKGSPEVVINYLRIRRDVEIQNKIMTTLIPILEQSKIEENRDTPTILLLDNPFIPDKKAKPKRLMVTVFVMSLVFIITYFYYFVRKVLKEKFS